MKTTKHVIQYFGSIIKLSITFNGDAPLFNFNIKSIAKLKYGVLMKNVSVTILFVVLFCTIVFSQTEQKKEESVGKGITLFKIEKNKDGTVKVFDLNGNQIQTPDLKVFADSIAKQYSKEKIKQEKGSSKQINSLEKSPEMKKYQPSQNEQIEKGNSINIESSSKSKEMKNQQETEIERNEKGNSIMIDSLSKGVERKYQQEHNNDQKEKGSSIKIEKTQSGKEMKLFYQPQNESGTSIQIDKQPVDIPLPLFDSSKKDLSYNPNGTPNLTIYTGTGSDNTYLYNTTTHVLGVNTSVQNNGTGAAGSFRVGFYLSTNNIISTSDDLIENVVVSSLSNGYYTNKSISVDLDNTSVPYGTYYVGVFFDDQSVVSESNENDNTVYYTPTIIYGSVGTPNLTIYTGTGSDNTYLYDTTTHVLGVNTSVQNNGTGAAGSFRVGFYLSTDNIISTSDDLIENAVVNSLSNGYYTNKSISVDLDNTSVPYGEYYVGVFFDDQSAVSESNENDNTVYYNSSIPVSVEDISSQIPGQYFLSQNYPNPFNPSTKISYDLSKEGMVSIMIYDMLGREVGNLVNEFKSAGRYSIEFNASNLSSGTYFYRITAGDFTEIKKLILMK